VYGDTTNPAATLLICSVPIQLLIIIVLVCCEKSTATTDLTPLLGQSEEANHGVVVEQV
jgi:hypothetical protein